MCCTERHKLIIAQRTFPMTKAFCWPGWGPFHWHFFCPQFKFHGKFAFLWFRCWSSGRTNVLHMPQQHSYRAMYKLCCDQCVRIKVRVKRNFYRIWIAIEKPLVNRGLIANASDSRPHLVRHLAIGFSVSCHYPDKGYTRTCLLIRYFVGIKDF